MISPALPNSDYSLLFPSDCDCPDCAPYCSTSGYCQYSKKSGSTPCQYKECYSDDDCYVEPDVSKRLSTLSGCFIFSRCDEHKCSRACGAPAPGVGFSDLKYVPQAVAISWQTLEVGKAAKRVGKCKTGECRNRAGLCCQPIKRSSRKICPVFC
jgi:hypothetical protein